MTIHERKRKNNPNPNELDKLLYNANARSIKGIIDKNQIEKLQKLEPSLDTQLLTSIDKTLKHSDKLALTNIFFFLFLSIGILLVTVSQALHFLDADAIFTINFSNFVFLSYVIIPVGIISGGIYIFKNRSQLKVGFTPNRMNSYPLVILIGEAIAVITIFLLDILYLLPPIKFGPTGITILIGIVSLVFAIIITKLISTNL